MGFNPSSNNVTGQTVTVTYTDSTTSTFTQSFSSFLAPAGFSGETAAVAELEYGYFEGGVVDGLDYLYDYSFALNSAKTVESLTLPDNPAVAIFAVTLTGGSSTSPNFTLSSSSSSLSLPLPGGSATSTITVNPANGFAGSVALAATGLPSGVTASFGANPTMGTSVLTLGIAPNMPPLLGTSTVTITGTSGSMAAITTLSLTVAAPPPSFVVSASPASLTITQGASGTSTITMNPANGFTGTVSLSCAITTSLSNVTAQPTCSLSPTSVNISGTSAGTTTLTVNTTAATALSRPFKSFFVPTGGVVLALLCFFGIPTRRRKGWALFALLLVMATTAAVGCGGGASNSGATRNSGTTAGAYTVTVTGTSSSLTQTTTVALTVN